MTIRSSFAGLFFAAMPLLASGAQAGTTTLPLGTGIEVYGYAGPGSDIVYNGVSYASPSLQSYSPGPGLNLPTPGTGAATSSPGLNSPGYSASSGGVSYQNAGETFTANANLPAGVLRVSAASNSVSYAASATAYLADAVTFHVTGPSPAIVDVRVSLDGVVADAGKNAGSYSSDLSFGFGGSFDYYGAIYNNGNTTYGFNGASGYGPIYGWGPSGTPQSDQSPYYKASGSDTGFVWNGQLYVTNGETLGLGMTLSTTVSGGATADFMNTAQVSFGLPSDVTFTSASGVLLTTSVPEPSTWAMMLLGLAGLGIAGVRRSRNESLSPDSV
jgi:hypothetical protein